MYIYRTVIIISCTIGAPLFAKSPWLSEQNSSDSQPWLAMVDISNVRSMTDSSVRYHHRL